MQGVPGRDWRTELRRPGRPRPSASWKTFRPTDGNEELTKAAAFGWLATAIAPKDPALAHSLIDRAFAIYLHPSDRSQHLYGGAIVPRKPPCWRIKPRLAGYPDMESAIYRVLAMRPTTKDAWSPVAVQRIVRNDGHVSGAGRSPAGQTDAASH